MTRGKTLTELNNMASPDISPMDAKIALDLCRWRVLATESIATPMVEGARARQRHKGKRGRIHW